MGQTSLASKVFSQADLKKSPCELIVSSAFPLETITQTFKFSAASLSFLFNLAGLRIDGKLLSKNLHICLELIFFLS